MENKFIEKLVCQDTIGKLKARKMGAWYRENAETLGEIRRYLLEYFSQNDPGYTKEEFVRYRDGVAAWELFICKCLEEGETSLKEDK